MRHRFRGRLGLLARALVSTGLLAYLVWSADPVKIWNQLRDVHAAFFLLALGLQAAGVVLSAAKWELILRVRGARPRFRWLLGVYAVGQFANNFTPTAVGGDAIRIALLGRRLESYSEAGASVFVERLTGFLALCLFADVALLLTVTDLVNGELSTGVGFRLLAAGFAAVALTALVVTANARRFEGRLGRRLLPRLAHRPLRAIVAALELYFPRGRVLVLVLGMSLLFQALWIGVHLLCGRALGIEAPLLLYVLIATVTDLVALAPIFLNSLGARELVFTVYLSQVGVPTATALALAFLVFLVRLLPSLAGGLVVLFGGAEFRVRRAGSQVPSDVSDSPI